MGVFPFIVSPLGGMLGAFTASFYVLDPTGNVPIEPLLDLIPGYSPLRVTFDMVDSESVTLSYDTTEHSIQDFLDVTSNIRKRLRSMTISGTLGATPPLTLGGPPAPVLGGVTRLDLIRLAHLEMIADQRRPIMAITPRYGLERAAITSVARNWTPGHGESMACTVTLKEIRLVSPITGDLVSPNYGGQTPGNNAPSGGGEASTTPAGETATASDTTGVPPTPDVITGAG